MNTEQKSCSSVKYEDDFIDEKELDISKKDQNITYARRIDIPNETEMVATNIHTIGLNSSIQSVVTNMAKISTNINGWNESASKTISNWYNVFREYSFIYQYVLDKNHKMASRLNMISTISSSTLGIFSAFKLWMNDEQTFRTTSDIILMIFNFGVAVMTTASKRYLDDSRNEKIRIHIEEIDKFIGEISAQILKMPEYRMDAKEFLTNHNDIYTKLITQQPSLTLDEIAEGKTLYKKLITYRPELFINTDEICINID